VVGGVVGGSTTLSFGEGMTRPVLQSSPNNKPAPDYTREAREARVSGLMIVKCVITTEGRVQNCQIIKPIPHMEQAVLAWLQASKYSPVTFQGKPQQVSYVFNFNLRLAE
jgi:protein TonB